MVVEILAILGGHSNARPFYTASFWRYHHLPVFLKSSFFV